MKTNLLQISAVLAAIVVAALLPISVAAASIAACADYGRNLEPLRPDSQVSPFNLAESKHAELSEAA